MRSIIVWLLALAWGGSAVLGADGPEDALARPTPQQAAWQDLEVGMFIHMAPQTWQDSESDTLATAPGEINPERLDTDQWVRVASSMGARYIVFVAKHEGGFCWWPTTTTEFCVRNSPWRQGRGDVLADLAASCRKAGIKLGVYLSPQDRIHRVGVGGRAADPAKQAEYEALFRSQLTEVLTGYGEIVEVWFDGSLVFDVGDILAACAPNAVVFQGPQASIRWVGNEDGVAPYPAWNAVMFGAKKWGDYTAEDGRPDGDRWLPNECDARIRDTWFWKTHNEHTLKSVEQLIDMHLQSVGRGATLLLNNTPDRTGLIPDADARRSAEFGAEVARRFGVAVADTSGQGPEHSLTFSAPVTIDHATIMEDVTKGERVRSYVLEAAVGATSEWKQVAAGSAIGHKRIERFAPVTASGLRLRVTGSVGQPLIRRFAAHRAAGSRRGPEPLSLETPTDYQVFQRATERAGIVGVRGWTGVACEAVEARLTGSSEWGEPDATWSRATPAADGSFALRLSAPAGGWYLLECRAVRAGAPIANVRVNHVGVGEVFVGAGQSNSTNCGGEGKLSCRTGMVSTFDCHAWRIADDPQPGVHDGSTGGSFWPAFGDAMHERFKVPIGVAVTGHGGTSINQWQRNGELFEWMMARVRALGPLGFRALLWHQGESDVGMTGDQYAAGLERIILDSREAAGREFPWVVARVSYHNPEKPSFDSTRAGQKALWDRGIALEGPDTDTLTGDHRDGGGRGIHFSPKGLDAHGRMWADKVGVWLEVRLRADAAARDGRPGEEAK
ncbi:MAG: alpha-L-fucosidase [Phycisphaerae bacterium]|nr:alpha-L-fucosidase [Phycisphaerae bacterium]